MHESMSCLPHNWWTSIWLGLSWSHGCNFNSSLLGNKIAGDLPYASTLCNQCGVVCPVKIPLPELMVKLRNKKFKSMNIFKFEKIILTFWSFISKNPRIFNFFCINN